MRPGQGPQLLGPGAGEKRDHHVRAHRLIGLGRRQQPGRLVRRQCLRRAAGGAPRRVDQQGDVALDMIMSLRPAKHRPQDPVKPVHRVGAEHRGPVREPRVDVVHGELNQPPPAQHRHQMGACQDSPVHDGARLL
jgi:hypothetical protein